MAKAKDPMAGVTFKEVTVNKLVFPKRASQKRKEEILNHVLDGTNRFTWADEEDGEIYSVFKDKNGNLQFCYEQLGDIEVLAGALYGVNEGEVVPVPVNDRSWRHGPEILGTFGEYDITIDGKYVHVGCQEESLTEFKKLIKTINDKLNG